MANVIPFESEFILHTLTQNYLKELFDLEFVASEIQLNDLRLDNLAFDLKTDSFVIIEYKNEFNANEISKQKNLTFQPTTELPSNNQLNGRRQANLIDNQSNK